MRVLKRVSIFAVAVLFAAFLFSTVADAQVMRDRYSFLEVGDFTDKPVPDAVVKVYDNESGQKTNQNGQLEKGLLVRPDVCNSAGFSITKDGYFPFFDFFGISDSFFRGRNDRHKIELLKIPETGDERKAVGREQEKRELFAAAKKGAAAAVGKLLKAGLSPNLMTDDLRGVPTEKGVPLMMFAAASGDGKTVGELLAAGAVVRSNDEPLRDVFVVYLNAGLCPWRYPDNQLETAEARAAFEDGAARLIKAGANYNPAKPCEKTTLMIAAEKGYLKTAALLIEKGVLVNAKDAYGQTALMYAVNDSRLSKTRLEMMSLLLKSNADPNAVTNDKGSPYYGCRTALMYAVQNGDLETVKLLLKNGASVNIACEGGETALNIAKSMLAGVYANEIREIIKLLEAAHAK